jgi:hypothetical protein
VPTAAHHAQKRRAGINYKYRQTDFLGAFTATGVTNLTSADARASLAIAPTPADGARLTLSPDSPHRRRALQREHLMLRCGKHAPRLTPTEYGSRLRSAASNQDKARTSSSFDVPVVTSPGVHARDDAIPTMRNMSDEEWHRRPFSG